MQRFQITITNELADKVNKLKKQKEISISEQVRRGLELLFKQKKYDKES